MLEWAIVALLVAASSAYAAWALLPASARLRLARRLARWPGPLARLGARLEQAAGPVSKRTGADCDACPHARLGNGSRRSPPTG